MRVLSIVLCAVAIATACAPRKSERNRDAEVVAANAKPQKVYPEFPLEAQRAAMQKLEAMRERARVPDLRATTPPRDWIALAYHGLVLDANYDVIELNAATVAAMQRSIVERLKEPVRARALQFDDDAANLSVEESVLVRNAAIESALVGDAQMQAQYGWRLRLMNRVRTTISPAARRLIAEIIGEQTRRGMQYVADCRAAGVPIPPDWPDARWISQGPLAFTAISKSLTAEVFAYKDPAVPGVCYALPRRDAAGNIQLLGIICQSEPTGNACFWDNRTPDDRTAITGRSITLDIENIANGRVLGENCTSCHRGDNVFNIHPGTALQLERIGAPGGPYTTTARVRYTPLGQANWENPGPLAIAPPPEDQSSCTACHDFPQTAGSSYCSNVLQQAAMFTMPPAGSRAGWPTGPVPVNPRYGDHITFLATCP